MNKIPRCITKNQIDRQYLKLTKKFLEQNKTIYNDSHSLKRDKSINSSNHFSKETTAYSLISTKKLSSASSKSNSLLVLKTIKKKSSNLNSFNNKQKVYSESRNLKRIKNRNKKEENTTKEMIDLAMKSKKGILKINLNNRNKVNLSLNKFPFIGGNFEKFLLSRLNRTFNESRVISLNNISLNKIKDRIVKEVNAEKNDKNVLL